MSTSAYEQLKREPSLAMRVTEKLLLSIASERLKVGDPLPSERELGDQFGVSRTVIREAVRGLEAKGVLVVVSGRAARVAAVPASRVLEAMDLYLQGLHSQNLINPADISEVRTTLELKLVQLACERATESDLAELAKTHEAMSEASTPTILGACDTAFHRSIALATHNALFLTLLDAINAEMISIRINSLSLAGRRELALTQHHDILKAIQGRNADAARDAMYQHLEDSRNYYAGGDPREPAGNAMTPTDAVNRASARAPLSD